MESIPLESKVLLVVNNLPVSAKEARDVGSIPGWGRSPREGNDNPATGAWGAVVHRLKTRVGHDLSVHTHTKQTPQNGGVVN